MYQVPANFSIITLATNRAYHVKNAGKLGQKEDVGVALAGPTRCAIPTQRFERSDKGLLPNSQIRLESFHHDALERFHGLRARHPAGACRLGEPLGRSE
jgi:hypothetical protein